jgi:DMSO/TMAO reductase YedYZ heme-binding membrane subunit
MISARATGESSILGATLLVLLILLALTFFLRKLLGRHWKRIHQILAAILMAIAIYHSLIEFL